MSATHIVFEWRAEDQTGQRVTVRESTEWPQRLQVDSWADPRYARTSGPLLSYSEVEKLRDVLTMWLDFMKVYAP